MRLTEVDHFYRVSVNYNILRFQIPVRNISTMTVCDCLQDLLDNKGSLFLGEMIARCDLCFEFYTIANLRHEMDLRLIFVNFV